MYHQSLPPLTVPLLCAILHVTGSLANTFIRTRNITAIEGSDVTLMCELSSSADKIIQVSWKICNGDYLAFHLIGSKTEGHVPKAFLDKVILEDGYGIAIRSVNSNDTGQYCCVFNIHPLGSIEGKIFLSITGENTKWSLPMYVWCTLPIVGLVLVVGLTRFYCYKRKTKLIGNNGNPAAAMAADPTVQDVAPVTMADKEDSNGPEYLNVLLYHQLYSTT
ncbi:T-cell immunoreceptor with Ig and ITIM domains [Discoglossus pictus]